MGGETPETHQQSTANAAGKSTAKRGMSDAGAGIRSARATNVFRAVNFELYAKPVRLHLQ